MALQERLLSLGQRRSMRGPAGERQPHREQRGLGLDPAQNHPQVVEVHFAFGRRSVGLRHVALLGWFARLGGDLRSAFAHVVTHRGIRQIRRAVLIDQSRQNPASRVSLLPRRIQVAAQHLIDQALERRQPRRGPPRRLARRRDRVRQRLPHRAPMHPILGSQLTDRQPVNPRVASDRGEQIHLRPHPPTPP